MFNEVEILRVSEVINRFGIGKTMLYSKINPASKYHDPTFPLPVVLGGRSIGFYRHELDEWALSRSRVTPEQRKDRAKPANEGRRRKRAESAAA
jgi:prophage regulatory protein